MVCHKPVLGEQRQRKRQALLKATEKSLEKISKEVARRKNKPLTAVEIGVKVGKVLGRYKMGKHFACKIGEGSFAWSRRAESMEQEEKLEDRKSTRLNSSHRCISYAVFCLTKKT